MKKEEMGLNFGNDNTEDLMRLAVQEAAKHDPETLELLCALPPNRTSEHNLLFHPDPIVRESYKTMILNDPVIR